MYTTQDFLKDRSTRRKKLAKVASQMEAEIAQATEATEANETV